MSFSRFQESDELNTENCALERELATLKAQKEHLESMFRRHKCVIYDTKSKENKATEPLTEAKSPQVCSGEVKPTTPTSSAADSVKA